MRAVSGQPGEIANPQDSNTSDFGHRHPVPHAILSENQASPSACRLLLWQPEELLQVREIVVRANKLLLAASAPIVSFHHALRSPLGHAVCAHFSASRCCISGGTDGVGLV